MYIPAHFREEDKELLHRLIRENSFGTLVTCHKAGPFASHVPFLLDTERGLHGTLRSHLARANPQWQSFEEGGEALVIFQGPHAYISPSWYETQPSVPTWNYTAVHAYGIPRLLDEAALHSILEDLVLTYESPSAEPWRFDSLSDEYVQKMERAIVGFEIEITRLEGKFKLSQNRSDADRMGTIAGLHQTGDPLGTAIAGWMEGNGQE